MAFGGAEAAPVHLDDVRVPHDALLGEPGKGFDVIARKFPTIQALLGEIQASVLGARAFVRSAAAMVDAGEPVAEVAAAVRLVAGRAAREVTSSALQLCGAYGLTRELAVERLYREGKFSEVAQGVAGIQRVMVGRRLLDARLT